MSVVSVVDRMRSALQYPGPALLLTVLVGCSTVSTTTTIPLPPPFPASSTTTPIVPTTTTTVTATGRTAVVVGFEGVLGWWDGSNWVQVQGSTPLTGGETYRVEILGRPGSSATGSAPAPGCDLVEGSMRVRLSPALSEVAIAGIAVTAPWDVTPHPVNEVEPDPALVEQVSNLLDVQGISDAEPSFVQLVEIDIEGDGSVERFGVVESSSNPALSPASAGDYSVAFADLGNDGELSVLNKTILAEDGEEGAIRELIVFRFQGFVDADNDGVDEVALGFRYAEGSGTQLFDTTASGGMRAVLAAACGL